MSNASVVMQLPSPSQSTLSSPLSPASNSLIAQPPNSPHHAYGTRKRQSSIVRPSQRNSENASLSPHQPVPTVRRIRPLGCVNQSTHANTISQFAVGEDIVLSKKEWKKVPAWRATSGTQQRQSIDFPPRHVVLHPEDASSKVFMAIGQSFMSVDNCAMTVKDLAELAMKNGLSCQNVSAAAQAITFFIRTHLHRCEVEEDYPLLLRHVLSGTPKDDALAPALYSRSGGNITKQQKDENMKDGIDRKTCFRRGTTVWYLSKAAGAPCPFARNGIALRDYSEVCAITGAESRKGPSKKIDVDTELSRGLKRKREREGLRRRTVTGTAVTRSDDEDDETNGRKPPKIKLTLRLRPCLTTMREKSEPAEDSMSSSGSDSDSDTDSHDGSMSVDDEDRAPVAAAELESKQVSSETSWAFPPYPIQRRISIPPYTPCEENYPTYYTSPTTEWSNVKLEPACMGNGASGSTYRRALSATYSVASPPPESDVEDEFADDEDGEEFSFCLSEVKKEIDDDFGYVWPQAAPTTSDATHDVVVKTEPDDEVTLSVGNSKRNSTQTLRNSFQFKAEDLPFDFEALDLSFDPAVEDNSEFPLFSSLKEEEEDTSGASLVWGQPVDLTPIDATTRTEDAQMMYTWKDIELVGPDSLDLQELEFGESDVEASRLTAPSMIVYTNQTVKAQDQDASTCPTSSILSQASSSASSSSLDDVVPSWAAGSLSSLSSSSPDTDIESLAPASPSPLYVSQSPDIVRGNSEDENRVFSSFMKDDALNDKTIIDKSAPLMIPSSSRNGSRSRGAATPQLLRSLVGDVPVSDASTPWERGMVSQDDIEERLLPLLSPSTEENTGRFEASPEALSPPPLSPQEAELFQTFCMVSDFDIDGDESKEGNSQLPEAFAASLFAATARPKMPRSSSSKRATKFDSKRMSLEKAGEEADHSADDDESGEVSGKKKNMNHPLRRSKRVATQTAREKLRKRA